jgi:hypothetical protein
MGTGSFGFNGRLTRLAGHIASPKSLLEKELQCDGKSLKDQKLSLGLGVWHLALMADLLSVCRSHASGITR